METSHQGFNCCLTKYQETHPTPKPDEVQKRKTNFPKKREMHPSPQMSRMRMHLFVTAIFRDETIFQFGNICDFSWAVCNGIAAGRRPRLRCAAMQTVEGSICAPHAA